MIQKARRLIAATLALLLLFSTSIVSAQNAQTGGSGLSISPLHTDVTLDPGKTKTLDITLKNVTSSAVVAKPSVVDFESDNTTGNPKIITDPSKKSPYSIRDFVSGLADITLAKGEKKTVTATLKTPDKQPPGAYFGIIRYKAVPAEATTPESGEVALTASVGTIVLITVPGSIRDQIQLTNLFVYRNSNNGTFFIAKPNQTGIEVKNLGNGFAQPFGTVELKNTFGKTVYSYQLNNVDPRGSVLPSSTRIFRNDIKNVSQPGRYKLTASVAYGSGAYVLVSEKTFWYIPVWLVVILLIILAALALLIYRVYKRRFVFKKRTSRKR
jgi:hypothetical protein